MHLVAALLLLSLAGGAVAPERPAASRSPITVDAASAAWRQRVEWAIGRFRAAGLELPAVAVSVHEDQAPCEGNGGLYHPGPIPEVRLCSSSPADSRAAALLTLHELGHAWAEAALDQGERRSLLALRGLEAWIDPDLPPHEWGAEHAAELLSWGLMEELVPIVRIEDAEPARLAAGFRLLTGRAPLWAEPAGTTVDGVAGLSLAVVEC